MYELKKRPFESEIAIYEMSVLKERIYKCTHPPRQQLFNMHDISNNKNGIHFLLFLH